MPEQKNQHYVPKCYLKQFSNQIGFFNFYDISKKYEKDVPHSTQCQKTYYYGEDKIWENKFKVFETSWGAILKKFSLIPDYFPSEQEITDLKRFAFYQRIRGVAQNEHVIKSQQEKVGLVAKMTFEKNGKIINDNDIRAITHSVMDEKQIPKSVLESQGEADSVINNLQYLIINYQSKYDLIISDNPVIIINRFVEQSIGFNNMGLVLFFPLTPKKLIVFYDEKMYPKYKNINLLTLRNYSEVLNLNTFQYISAENLLFSLNPVLDNLQLNSTKSNLRNANRSTSAITALGSNQQKLIVNGCRLSIYHCVLSFAQLTQAAQKIPYPCREAVPREFEREWLNKLEIKIGSLPEIVKIVKCDLGLTSKEIRVGCNEMFNFAKNYWNLK